MIGIRRTTRSPIGLDVGSRYIKAAQLVGPPEKAALAATMSIERVEPGADWTEAESQRLQAVLDRRGFEGRAVITAVPTAQCLTGVLSLPPAESGAPLREIATTEMAHMHRCAPEQIQVALWNLPEPARAGDGQPVMAAGCQHDHAETLLTNLEGAGLEVSALDIEGWALVRACRSQLPGPDGAAAILDLGWQAANLALVHGTTLIYKRLLSGAGLSTLAESARRDHRFEQPVIDHLLTSVGLDDAALEASEDPQLAARMRQSLEGHIEQIIQELSLSLSYAAHQYPEAPVQRLLLAGGGARMPGLASMMSQRLDVQVSTARPELACDVPAPLAGDGAAPELSLAVGLALYREQEAAA